MPSSFFFLISASFFAFSALAFAFASALIFSNMSSAAELAALLVYDGLPEKVRMPLNLGKSLSSTGGYAVAYTLTLGCDRRRPSDV